MRKYIKTFAAALFLSTVLTGCAESSSEPASPQTSKIQEAPVSSPAAKDTAGQAQFTVTTASSDLRIYAQPILTSEFLQNTVEGKVYGCYGKITDDNSTRNWYEVLLDDGSLGYMLVYNLSDITETLPEDEEAQN